MGGLGVLFVVGLYLFVAYKIVNSTKTKPTRWLAVVILTLIPTADAVVGRVYLKHLCATEGGLRVSKVVTGVEGFMIDSGVTDYWVKTHGYQFVESRPLNERVNRFSRQNDKIILEENVVPKSLYRLHFVKEGDKDFYWKQQRRVEVISTNEILATDTTIGFSGGWAEYFLARFSDAGPGSVAWCDSENNSPEEKYTRVVLNSLKPQPR